MTAQCRTDERAHARTAGLIRRMSTRLRWQAPQERHGQNGLPAFVVDLHRLIDARKRAGEGASETRAIAAAPNSSIDGSGSGP